MLYIGNTNCDKCVIHTKQPPTPNVIVPDCEVAVVGAYPKKSNLSVIKEALSAAKINPQKVSFLNAIQCQKEGKSIKKEWWKACYPNFVASMAAMPNVKLVILLGADSYKLVSNSGSGTMASVFMKPFSLEEYPNTIFITNYDPSSFIYDESKKHVFFDGFKTSLGILKAKKEMEVKKFKHVYLMESKDLRNWLPIIEKQPRLALDTEFSDLAIQKARLISIHLSWEDNSAIAIPWSYYYEKDDELKPYWNELCQSEIKQAMQVVAQGAGRSITTQNGKVDSLIFWKTFGESCRLKNIVFDTFHKGFLENSNNSNDLDSLIVRERPDLAGGKLDFWNGISDVDKKNGVWWKHKTLEEILEYGNYDAEKTWILTSIMHDRWRD